MKEAQSRYDTLIVRGSRHPKDAFPGIFIVSDCGDPKKQLDDILAKDPSLKKLRSRIVFDVVST